MLQGRFIESQGHSRGSLDILGGTRGFQEVSGDFREVPWGLRRVSGGLMGSSRGSQMIS